MCPTSVRLEKEAAGGGRSFVRLWGRQMGHGHLQLEQKAKPLMPLGKNAASLIYRREREKIIQQMRIFLKI